jgi:pSer/pThr/pTyr-binding forkhead associated (FHA) protein
MGVLQHLSSGTNIVLAAHSVAGRLPTSVIPLTHSAASTQHASLFWTGRRWEVRDLGSVNGTHLNREKLAVGQNHPVRLGNILRFGSDDEQWKLVDDRGPVASAKCLETGVERYGESGVLALPDDDNVLATITKNDEGRFVLDVGDDNPRLVDSDERLTFAGQEWVLTLPPVTPIAGTYKQPTQLSLNMLQIEVHVSQDGDHVWLHLRHGSEEIQIEEKAYFHVLHVLALKRIKDRDESSAHDSEQGWFAFDELVLKTKGKPTPEKTRALNVDIHRLRELFLEVGIEDGDSIVDTSRRGKRRLGTAQVKVIPA